MPDSDLLKLFHAESGVVSCVGAGGKKTLIFRLAEQHPGRVAITATAHIEFFPKTLQATNYIDDEDRLLKAIAADTESRSIAFARSSRRFGRHAGIGTDTVQRFMQAGRFDLMVIKADGARGRLIKSPSRDEPALPRYSDTVVPVLSAKAIGRTFNGGIVHRVAAFAHVTGLQEGQEIEPIHIARLLSSEHGSLKGVGKAKVIPLINMVDDAELESVATLAAKEALNMTDRFGSIVLATMKKEEPVVAVIKR